MRDNLQRSRRRKIERELGDHVDNRLQGHLDDDGEVDRTIRYGIKRLAAGAVSHAGRGMSIATACGTRCEKPTGREPDPPVRFACSTVRRSAEERLPVVVDPVGAKGF